MEIKWKKYCDLFDIAVTVHLLCYILYREHISLYASAKL